MQGLTWQINGALKEVCKDTQYKFSYPFIILTWCRRPLIFQIMTYVRLCSFTLKYQRFYIIRLQRYWDYKIGFGIIAHLLCNIQITKTKYYGLSTLEDLNSIRINDLRKRKYLYKHIYKPYNQWVFLTYNQYRSKTTYTLTYINMNFLIIGCLQYFTL